MFIKYQHVEKLGNDEVEGLLDGECWVFPKLDGTNASVWLEDTLCAGSRRRKLTLENDNAGFYAYICDSEITAPLIAYLALNPSWILYGEWLVPHTLKTYRDDTWRKFYVFDVYDREQERLLSYEEYKDVLCRLNVIPPIVKVTRPSIEFLTMKSETNTYLIKDGQGAGEGLVVKRYDFQNKYGRMTWGKLVRNEFKDAHTHASKVPGTELIDVEYKIVTQFLTVSIVNKIIADMTINTGWTSRMIPQLLGRVWHDFVTEEIWGILKEHKNPTINFKRLNRYVVTQIKKLKSELF